MTSTGPPGRWPRPAGARIHTFIATSDLHLSQKLRMTREACLTAATESVARARSFTDDVEFSAEDATRSDMDFLCRVVESVIDAGATTINLPDTVGYSTPDEIGEFFRTIITRVPNAHRAIFSAHCHDDLGLAVANTLAAICAGARQVECTINGIGERAGNASIEEIVMATRVRPDRLPVETRVVSEQLYASSQMLTEITGERVQANKAIVGRNAFAHEAGIHQDGMLKDRRTYEIMRPEDVGVPQTTLVLGKHSGRHAVQKHCETARSVALAPGPRSGLSPHRRARRRAEARVGRRFARDHDGGLRRMRASAVAGRDACRMKPGTDSACERTHRRAARRRRRARSHSRCGPRALGVGRKFGHALDFVEARDRRRRDSRGLASPSGSRHSLRRSLRRRCCLAPSAIPISIICRRLRGPSLRCSRCGASSASTRISGPRAPGPDWSRPGPLKPEVLRGTDLIVVRELTGGLYYGQPRGIAS